MYGRGRMYGRGGHALRSGVLALVLCLMYLAPCGVGSAGEVVMPREAGYLAPCR